MIVTFPDGTRLRASSLLARDAVAVQPGFGLYLDRRWRPSWPSEFVEWEDFGTPSDPPRAAGQIRSAFARAVGGEEVEVGCFAGLGRTGTVLARMAVLAGVPSEHAVAWVRAHYDPDAVETEAQERWVLWFAAAAAQGTDAPVG